MADESWTWRPVQRAETRWIVPMRLLAAVSAAAAAIVLYATSFAPWAFSDGAGYLMLARNLLSGRGLGLMRASGDFQPLSMHPPLYPLSLAFFGLSGAELLSVARWLDAGLFALTVFIIGATIFWVTRNTWLALAAASITLVSPSLVGLYAGAMSEPLFFVLGLASLLSILVFLETDRRWLLALAGLAAGATVVTRYLGLAYVGAGIVGLLILGSRTPRRRITDAIVYMLLAAAPTVLWFGWVNAQSGADAPRQWLFDLSDLWARTEPIRGGVVAEVWSWIPFAAATAVPYRYQLGAVAVIAVMLGALLALALRRLNRATALLQNRAVQSVTLQAAMILIYMTTLSAVFLFGRPPLDAGDIDQRILTPVYIAMILGVFSAIPLTLEAWPKRRWIISVPLVAAALAIVWYLPQSLQIASDLRERSRGFTSVAWQNSETVKTAAALAQDIALISNESTAIMFHLDRPAYDVPELLRGEPLETYTRFGEGDFGEERIFREQGAALVLFDSVFWQLRPMYGDETEARLQQLTEGLDLYADLADGAIYFYPSAGSG
ncbi:MAG: hypothetical protein BMS9Abin28_1566 [Anaerolineae bacterium]|nr:MAG: hypothetical protein BMS9Abin28_1566 [Anaerolineae bacterium]